MHYTQLPFEQADNPVMSIVAFLAGVVGPGVAAEAAKTAMKELTNGKQDEGEGEKEGEKAEGGKGRGRRCPHTHLIRHPIRIEIPPGEGELLQ